MTKERSNLSNQKTSHNVFQLSVFVSIIILIFAFQTSDKLSHIIEDNLWGHMIIEHSIFFLLGYQIPFILYKLRGMRISLRRQKRIYFVEPFQSFPEKKSGKQETKNERYIWIVLIIMILYFWHIPIIFDIANYYNLVHLIQHISFVIVGICIYQTIKKFDLSFILVLLLLTCGTMGIIGLYLALSNHSIYSFYTVQDNQDAGNYMIIMAITMTIVLFPLFLIRKAVKLIHDDDVQ